VGAIGRINLKHTANRPTAEISTRLWNSHLQHAAGLLHDNAVRSTLSQQQLRFLSTVYPNRTAVSAVAIFLMESSGQRHLSSRKKVSRCND